MVEAALTAPSPGYAVLYGISANTRAWWDLEPGLRLGYDPHDDAEHSRTASSQVSTTRRRPSSSAARSPSPGSTVPRSAARLDLECIQGGH